MIYKTFRLLIFIVLFNSCNLLAPKRETNTQTFNVFLNKIFDEHTARYPLRQTRLGMKDNYDKLNDISEEHKKTENRFNRQYLKQLRQFDFKKLNKKDQISYFLLEEDLKAKQKDFQYRFFHYPVNQLFGVHTWIPAFMVNYHAVESYEQAEAYISRVKAIKPFMQDLISNLKLQEKKGIIPPAFIFSKIAEQMKNILKGRPFEKGRDNFLYADFKRKIQTLVKKKSLLLELEQALLTAYKPAYQDLLKYWRQLEKKADNRAGVWKFKGGDEYYRWLVYKHSTTRLSPEEIHSLGLKEMARIHKEMKIIKNKIGFKGSLKQFFKFITEKFNNRRLYYSNTPAGRRAYLSTVKLRIAQMRKKLPLYFNILPKAELEVKRVEAFREKAASLAFYQRPSPDGKKQPGIYYINLFNMQKAPAYQLEALTYHEAVPGHHLQIAISMEQKDLPKFRKFLSAYHTAYVEGWGLYAEKLAKEMGFYKSLYSQLGQLSMELRRAGRLVVDTGIHYKKWTRRQAIDFLLNNTPEVEEEHISSIDRYIVNPGQALAYTIGMLKIMELRKKAKSALNERFDIRAFHDHILQNGSVPLSLLEQLTEEWILNQKNTNK